MTDKLESSLNALSRIVFHDETHIFNNEFYNDKKLLGEGYRFVSESKPDMFFEAYVRFPENRNQEVDIITYEHYKLHKLKNLFFEIENELAKLSYSKNKNIYDLLIHVYDELTAFFNKVVKEDKEHIISEILSLREILQLKYGHIVDYHKFYEIRKPNENLSDGLFQPKDLLKRPFLEELYLILVDSWIIDPEITSMNDFTDTLTSPNPKSIIQFTENNYIVVHVIDQLSHFYHSLTSTTIGNSKLFYKKGGEPFREGDINTARSRGMNKQLMKKKKFDRAFANLKRSYSI